MPTLLGASCSGRFDAMKSRTTSHTHRNEERESRGAPRANYDRSGRHTCASKGVTQSTELIQIKKIK